MATKVNTAAEILPVLSVLKFRRPIARPPRTTVNWSHERNVRSFAKNTNRLEVCWSRDEYPLVRLGRGGQFGSL